MRKHFAKLNKTYIVKAIPDKLKARLAGLGITENTAIFIKAFAPLGDPVIITVRGVDYAVRESALKRLSVKEAE